MIHVVASIWVKAGHLSEFLGKFQANVPNVLAEQGCIRYLPVVDIDADLAPQVLDANLVTVIEQWESLEALRVHLTAPHMLSYREEVKNIVEDLSLKVLQEV